jgi:hypothetical protein
VLLDDPVYVDQIQLPNEFLMALGGKDFGEAIGDHFCGRDPMDCDPTSLGLLAEPALVDVDVFQGCLELWRLLCQNLDRLLIVAGDNWMLLYIKLYIVEEPFPPNKMLRRLGDRQEFGFR